MSCSGNSPDHGAPYKLAYAGGCRMSNANESKRRLSVPDPWDVIAEARHERGSIVARWIRLALKAVIGVAASASRRRPYAATHDAALVFANSPDSGSFHAAGDDDALVACATDPMSSSR